MVDQQVIETGTGLGELMPRGCARKILDRLFVILLAAVLAGCTAEPPGHGSADLVFRGGAVYTLDPEQPWARAVAVSDGRIAYVGDDSGVADWIGEGTEVIELGDGMLLPGFHDSHMHPMAAGARYLACPLNVLDWPDEVLVTLAQCAAGLDDGQWLRATGLNQEVLDGAGPGVGLLDLVSAGHPAMVSSRYGAVVWLNSEALRLAGIDANTPDPPDGEIVRDATGAASGILRGGAVGLAWQLASDYSEKELRLGLKRASRFANSLGITSSNEASASAAQWRAYRAAERAGEMTLRVNASLKWDPALGPEQLQELATMRDASDGPWFSADSVKLFLDGSAVGRASVLEPYAGTEDNGQSNYGDKLTALVTRLDQAGFQLHMHAYGDRAVRDGLDAVAAAIETNPPRDRRHQLAHVALIDPEDLPRFAELGVTADIQPLWSWLDEERQAECESFGPERCARFLAFRDLFDSGAPVVAGSDWISASMDPLYGIQIAITRRSPDGSGPAWNPEQRVTLREMLEAYTIAGARLYGQDKNTGSIEVGKAADLVVLERNLFEVEPMEIQEVDVLLTLLAGEVVYRFGADIY
jgi:predicted amidohydrolase YtcJ